MIVKNLKKTYGEKTVLNINEFSFEPGKIYAIIGANGSGKSTFLKIIAGTLKPSEKPEITLDGKTLAYMPQKNYAFKTTVLKNVMLSAKNKTEDITTAKEYLSEMKIDHLKNQNASKLSGGETARMCLCRIFLSNSDIILLDEPTAAMDIESTLLSEALIKKYIKKTNATIIMVTHSVNQAKRLSDEVIFMKDGQIIEYGKSNEILNLPSKPESKEFLEFFSSEI